MPETYRRRVTVTYEAEVEFRTDEALAHSSTATAIAESLAFRFLDRDALVGSGDSTRAVHVEDEDGYGPVWIRVLGYKGPDVQEVSVTRLSER